MNIDDVLNRFAKECPITVMARLALSRMLDVERLDRLFQRHAVQQKCGDLLFSTIADLMGLVVLKIRPSVHAAYKQREEEVTVSVTSIYNKLQGIEPQVSRALVRETADDLAKLLANMRGAPQTPVLPGYKTRIVDGNHLAGTEHRIEELRVLGAAALPGLCLPILDPDDRLMLDVIPCEDGHASEATLFPEILALVQPGEVWVGDRNFGSQLMMTAIAIDKRSHFIFRHSMGLVPHWESVGRRSKIGQVDGGTLYEQSIEITYKGRTLPLRRITVVLDKPTRKGEKEVHFLSNLPKRVSAKKIAAAYRKRWKIESAFQELARSLNSEISTLGYPQAALFSFCMGLMMFNLLSAIKSTIAIAQGLDETDDEISTYFVALDVSSSWHGFAIAITDDEFASHYGRLSHKQIAKKLLQLGKHVNFRKIRKSKRGPKKPPPKRKSGNRGNHVSTARILAESRGSS